MIFEETPLAGAFVVRLEARTDHRGHFARVFDHDELAVRGFEPGVLQANVSFNQAAGTLRGMHFQHPPAAETKLVRCTRGAFYDVIIDLRPDSPSFTTHFGVTLSDSNLTMLLVPRGCAHGYLTVEDGTEAFYMVDERYSPESEGGIRYDDPMFGIEWPGQVETISDKDAAWPDFDVSTWSW